MTITSQKTTKNPSKNKDFIIAARRFVFVVEFSYEERNRKRKNEIRYSHITHNYEETPMTVTYTIDRDHKTIIADFQKPGGSSKVKITFTDVPDTWTSSEFCWPAAAEAAIQQHTNSHLIRRIEDLPPTINVSGASLQIRC